VRIGGRPGDSIASGLGGEAGGPPLMGLTVDSPIPQEALEQIVEAVGMKSARSIVSSA
jgi:hypothetical protein